VDSKAECDQLNLAQVARKNLVRYRLRSVKAVQKEPGRLWRKGFVKGMMSFKCGVKGTRDRFVDANYLSKCSNTAGCCSDEVWCSVPCPGGRDWKCTVTRGVYTI